MQYLGFLPEMYVMRRASHLLVLSHQSRSFYPSTP